MVGFRLDLRSRIKATAKFVCLTGLAAFALAVVYAIIMTMLELNQLLPKGAERVPMWFARWMMFSVFSMLFGGIGWAACNWKKVYEEFIG